MTDITLNHITKIEGHASLKVGIEKGEVTVCELSAVEGARYFEGIVVGRQFVEAHEMTSRICGICSSAHVIAAIMAIEDACDCTPTAQTTALRELLTLGERIRSHATHLYFLSLPDFLGFESALAMAPTHKDELKHALRLMKAGNHVVKAIGGRDLHPVSATVGGWLKLPRTEDLRSLAKELKAVKADAIATCEIFSSLRYPDFATNAVTYSLKKEGEFPLLHGDFSSKEASFLKRDYRKHINEERRGNSTANYVTADGKRFMVGALSRFNTGARYLSPDAKMMLEKSPLKVPSQNPFHNIVAQAIELVHCIDHAVRICDTVTISEEAVQEVVPKAKVGVGVLEVPRGTLWHEYELDASGRILHANIITPTAQNLYNIQEDIREIIPSIKDRAKEEIVMEIEKLIRSYDPCFSCSAHFLEVTWQ